MIKLFICLITGLPILANLQLDYRVFSKSLDAFSGQNIYIMPDSVVITSFVDEMRIPKISYYGNWYKKERVIYLQQNNGDIKTYTLDTLKRISFLIEKNELGYWEENRDSLLNSIQDDPELVEVFKDAYETGDPIPLEEQEEILFRKKFLKVNDVLRGRDIFIEEPDHMLNNKLMKKVERFYYKAVPGKN
ncbi:MAG: hypothetical protein KDC79_16745 [Cyclobacteriaceae bacterium]|nr:hypothetical protein [Cyclobacteriaceae bacterium]